MKPGGGKAKGAAFERHVCVELSHWMTDGNRNDLFWRSAMSGGRATVRAKRGQKNQSQLGDISSIDPVGHLFTKLFVVECKFIADANFEAWVLGQRGMAHGFWKTLCKIVMDDGVKWPMLIIKQNRADIKVLVGVKGRDFLGLEHDPHHRLWHQSVQRAYMFDFKTVMESQWPA